MMNLKSFKILFLLASMILLGQAASAYDFEVNGFFYNINEDSTTVTLTTESGSFGSYNVVGDLILRRTITYNGTTYTLTAIDRYAFDKCEEMTAVTIPNSVTRIDDGAFYHCSKLEYIDMYENNIDFVGYDAFKGTKWLDNQPDGVVYVGSAAYLYKGTMPENTSIVIREGTTCISGYAFQNCRNLTEITLPNSVTTIGYRSFAQCRGLTSITLPENIQSLGWAGFESCTGLTSVTIPGSLPVVDPRAFAGCTALTSVIICNGVTGIDFSAFEDCSALASVYIPESVTMISYEVFAGCTGLTDIQVASGNPKFDSRDNCNAIIVTETNLLTVGCSTSFIPNTVETIGYYAFQDCASLTSIFIPSSVTMLYGNSFAGCTSLTSIRVDNANTVYDSRGNCNAVIETATNTLVAGCKATVIPGSVTTLGLRAFKDHRTLTNIVIPTSVTEIGDHAFDGCSGLDSIDIPLSVTKVGRYSFHDCTGFTDLVIPNSITETDYCTFSGCSNVKNLTLPETLTRIGYMSFSECMGLTNVTIPASVNYISGYAFSGCSYLRTVTCLATEPPYLGPYNFSTFSRTLRVPITAVDDYSTAENWSKFTTIEGIFVPGMRFEVDGIYYETTSENTVKVTYRDENYNTYSGNVVIPDSVSFMEHSFDVTAIGEHAFDDSDMLESVKIPNSVTTIGMQAFQGCTSLSSLVIGSSVDSISAQAFGYCNALASVKCMGMVPPKMANVNVFSNKAYSQAVLSVPLTAIDDYNAADYWYRFSTIEGFGPAGDLNGDGVLSIGDVTLMVDLLLQGAGASVANGDVNGDGIVSIGDVTSLIDILLAGNN